MRKKSIADKIDESKKTTLVPEKEEKKSGKNKLIKVINYLNDHYEFRWNEINTDTEFRKLDSSKTDKENPFIYFDDREYRDVILDVKINGGVDISDQDFRYIVYGNQVSKPFNPFREYLHKTIPQADDGHDYIRDYVNQIILQDPTEREYVYEGFKKWWVAYVNGLLKDEPDMYNINQVCIVLVGGQGKFKTTFLKRLIPVHLQMKYFYGSTFQVHNKDHEKYLAYKMIINFDEMASFNKNDIESIKAKLTLDQVVVRLPYAKADIHLKRRASFTGTNNNIEFLKDDTGTRRFLPVLVEDIRLLPEFEIDRMYTQGKALLKSGFRYWFNSDEIKAQEIYNEKFKFKSGEEELIEKYFVCPTELEVRSKQLADREFAGFLTFLSASEVAEYITSKSTKMNNNNTVIQNCGKILKKLGYRKYNVDQNGIKNAAKKYALIEFSQPVSKLSESEYSKEFVSEDVI
jgi:predicted P-loop ATPase